MGAEAYLYKELWHGKEVVKKFRRPKSYRIQAIDQQIRQYRTIHEAKLITEARKSGVPTPIIYQVDIPNTTIIMEFLEGQRIKEFFQESEDSENICKIIGKLVGLLHKSGIVHGDLTTSNMILSNNKVYFIDFGLGDFTRSVEAFGVDLHLLKRALESTHYKKVKEYFQIIESEYVKQMDEKGLEVKERLREIRSRGRYVIRKKND